MAKQLTLCPCYEEIECTTSYITDYMRGYYAAKGWSVPEVVVKSICNGTKERDECSCDGDRRYCTFYKDVREKAISKEQSDK